ARAAALFHCLTFTLISSRRTRRKESSWRRTQRLARIIATRFFSRKIGRAAIILQEVTSSSDQSSQHKVSAGLSSDCALASSSGMSGTRHCGGEGDRPSMHQLREAPVAEKARTRIQRLPKKPTSSI